MTTTYKANWKAVFRSLGWLAVFCLPALTVVALLLMIPTSLSGGLFFLIGIPLLLIGFGFLFCLFLLVTALSHRITISQDGIAYHRWPLKTIRARWDEVEKIKRRRFLYRGKATLLVRRKKPGYEFKLGPWMLGSAAYDNVPLSDFSGWKDGHILEEMKVHQPQLSVDPPSKNDQVPVVDDRGQLSRR
jgi:hypothetical protein